jgi:hypothetical protein
MHIARLFIQAVAASLVCFAPPIAAQVTSGIVAALGPDSWSVSASPGQSMVQIGKVAIGGNAQFMGGCSKAIGEGFIGTFSRYRGAGLQTIGGESERVLFEVTGEDWKEAFAAQLRYSPVSGSWEIANPIAPVFLASFSRGQELSVLNSQRQKVFSFDLTGSTAAVRAMRSVCGLP